MEHMLELGIVSGPVVTGEHFEGGRFETEKLAAQFHIEIGQIEAGKGRDLVPPASQGRHGERYRGKPRTVRRQ